MEKQDFSVKEQDYKRRNRPYLTFNYTHDFGNFYVNDCYLRTFRWRQVVEQLLTRFTFKIHLADYKAHIPSPAYFSQPVY